MFATGEHYFVKPDSPSGNPFERMLGHVFPELMADVVNRDDIISVRSFAAPETAVSAVSGPDADRQSLLGTRGHPGLQDCVAAGQGDGTLTVVHKGNALGHFGSETAVNMISEQTESLIAALGMPGQINIYPDRTGLPADASLTVDLGDTSLDVLSRAFYDGDAGLAEVAVELRMLRTALETSNTLVAGFEPEKGPDAIARILDQRLSAMIGTQEHLATLLAAASDPHAHDPVIVTPSVLGAAGRGDAPGGTVSANIFQTSIELPAAQTPLTTLGNTLVLPFFTEPVRRGDLDLATPQGAFDWGADTRHLTDPVVTAEGTSYFGRIAQTLASCLDDNATVEIDLIGLGSNSWVGPTVTTSADTLSYFLAEGRRIGALRRLGELMTAADQPRVLVQLADESKIPMTELIARATRLSGVNALLPRFGRFESRSGFEPRRATLLGVTDLNPDVASPLEELFARSVVLNFVRTDGGPCRF